jgi:PhnB protein
MTVRVRLIPRGYHAVTPYLYIHGVASAIDFHKHAFGAREVMRIGAPDGKIGHKEIAMGESGIMVPDEYPDTNLRSPRSIGGSPVHIHLYVEDVDSTVKHAVAAGAKVLKPVADQFYGDRSGSLEDPFGHMWHVATHKEDLPAEEIQKRAAAQTR